MSYVSTLLPLRRLIGLPLWLALAMTLCNACKPVVIDDTMYLFLARQMVKTPLQPYGPPPGTKIVWYQNAEPAFEILLPPAFPYWLSLGLSCFGESIILLKLTLFPFAWMFTSSLAFLLRRICPAVETPLLWLTVLSPTFLPSMNLMLDVPTISLVLTAVRIFWSAERYWQSISAGLLTGLAMQTKYTAFSLPVLLLLVGWQFGKFRQAILAVSVALGLFANWEYYMARVYGHSHFLYHANIQQESLRQLQERKLGRPLKGIIEKFKGAVDEKLKLANPLVGNLGGLFAVASLVGWAALGVGHRAILFGLLLVILHFEFLLVLPDSWYVLSESPYITWNSAFTTTFGYGGLLAMAGCAVVLLLRKGERPEIAVNRLLVLWMLLEFGCYFALSPFEAARRLMGIVLAGTLVCGRCWQLRYGNSPICDRLGSLSPRCFRCLTIVGCSVGCFYAAVDYFDAFVEPNGVTEAKEWIANQEEPQGTIWFAGHWGFQWYATQAGMREIWPDETVIQKGDWAVIPIELYRPDHQSIAVPPWLKPMKTLTISHLHFGIHQRFDFPLPATIPIYYSGSRSMNRASEPRMVLMICRALKTFKLESGP